MNRKPACRRWTGRHHRRGRQIFSRDVCKATARRRSETVARARHKLQRRVRKYHVKLHDSPSDTTRKLHAVLTRVEDSGKQRQIASERLRVIKELSSSREIIQQERQHRPPFRLSSASWDDLEFEHVAEQLESTDLNAKNARVFSATAWLLFRTRCLRPCWTDKRFRSCLRCLALVCNSSSATTERYLPSLLFAFTRRGGYRVRLLMFAM